MNETVHHFSHESMSTSFEVIIDSENREYARQTAGAIFRRIDQLENLLSKYNPGSDIGQINLLKAGESIRVSSEVIDCLETAMWAYRSTGGLFDPTLGSGFQWLEIDRENFRVGWKAGGKASLDLGGLGKGYALDDVTTILEDWEMNEVVLNGGGSTALALGREWTLGVGGPWGEKVGLSEVTLKNRALSGSGTEVKGAHIINPKTGKPAQRHLAAWAIHPSAAKADALSTAFMMMENEKIKALCKKHPEITAYVVEPDETLIKIGV
ncbi:FAD:protein FMN transferase [Pontiella agarivorans]|uniref:FAD:protein FMN transferase n=1 Tax=Pontiella agarivorans TaxID=3038953 RepID=A0ABU5MWK9_9BACT|nr:FAD:protein FMN transferase [Pontiella agarivorans]MDZ8118599.1 FAD:protein FMN transferase [Pontiella agarivorans]